MTDILTKEMIILPDGKEIRIYIDDDLRQHILPSVTSLIGIDEKKYITKWKANHEHWKDILLFAGTVGTITHYRISAELSQEWGFPNEPLDLNPNQQLALSQWKDEFPYDSNRWGIIHTVKMNMVCFAEWREKYHPQPPVFDPSVNIIPSEHKICSRKFFYGGTSDLLCNINSLNYIVDFKTNNNYDYYLQLTAYRLALEEMYPKIKIDRMAIVNLTRFEEKMTELIYDKKMWLKYLADFYKRYGDIPPFNKNTVFILKNIKEEGIVF